MSQFLPFIVAGILLLVLFFWLLRGKSQRPATSAREELEPLALLHCRYFPQLRQALSSADAEFVQSRAAGPLARHWGQERRQVVRAYLAGLREDYQQLDQLSRKLASRAPGLIPAQERERLMLNARFRVSYELVRLRLLVDGRAISQVARLANLVGNLAVEMERGMAAMQRTGSQTSGGINV